MYKYHFNIPFLNEVMLPKGKHMMLYIFEHIERFINGKSQTKLKITPISDYVYEPFTNTIYDITYGTSFDQISPQQYTYVFHESGIPNLPTGNRYKIGFMLKYCYHTVNFNLPSNNSIYQVPLSLGEEIDLLRFKCYGITTYKSEKFMIISNKPYAESYIPIITNPDDDPSDAEITDYKTHWESFLKLSEATSFEHTFDQPYYSDTASDQSYNSSYYDHTSDSSSTEYKISLVPKSRAHLVKSNAVKEQLNDIKPKTLSPNEIKNGHLRIPKGRRV